MNKQISLLLTLALVAQPLAAADAGAANANAAKTPSLTEKLGNWLKGSSNNSGSLEYGTFSSDAGRYYYELGGTDLTPPSIGGFSHSQQLLNFGASAGVTYSCGNLAANYTASLKELNNAIKDLPNQIQSMAQSALAGGIAALPMYILNEANPVLAQVLANSLFTMDENFRMSVKSCEQLESSIMAGDGVGDWVSFNISKGLQNQAANPNQSAPEVIKAAQTNASCKDGGITWFEPTTKYGKTDPLLIEEHTIIAGYNALRDKALDSTDEATAQEKKSSTIMNQWHQPKYAAKFVTETIGSTQVMLCAGDKAKVSVRHQPGATLKSKYDQWNQDFKIKLNTIINSPQQAQKSDYEAFGNLELSSELIEHIRRLKPSNQTLTISRLASSFAYEKARQQALDAVALMRIGSQTQNIASASPAQSYIQDAINHLYNDIDDLKRRAEPSQSASVILQILDN